MLFLIYIYFYFNFLSDILIFSVYLFLIEINLIYNILVSGIQLSDLMIIYITKRSPQYV